MKYNKDNLKNIYNYDHSLIDKINKNLELYKQHEGFEWNYMFIIEKINNDFNYFKEDQKSFIYYLTDNVYNNDALKHINDYIYALTQVCKHNSYFSLLQIVNNGNEHLYKYYKDLKSFYSIYEKRAMEKECIDHIEKFSNDTNAKKLLPLIQNAKSKFIQIIKDKRTLKVEEIVNEEKVLEQLYKENYDKFNKIFFNQLHVSK